MCDLYRSLVNICARKGRNKTLRRIVAFILLICIVFIDFSRAYGDVSVSTLAPPLASKPPCNIVKNFDGEYEIVTDGRVLEFWQKETAEAGETFQDQLRTGWVFVELQYIMAQALELGLGKDTLKKILSRYVDTRGVARAFLEAGYDLGGIGENRGPGGSLIELTIPIRRQDKSELLLRYNRLKGGMEIDLYGKKFFMHAEVNKEKIIQAVDGTYPRDAFITGSMDDSRRQLITSVIKGEEVAGDEDGNAVVANSLNTICVEVHENLDYGHYIRDFSDKGVEFGRNMVLVHLDDSTMIRGLKNEKSPSFNVYGSFDGEIDRGDFSFLDSGSGKDFSAVMITGRYYNDCVRRSFQDIAGAFNTRGRSAQFHFVADKLYDKMVGNKLAEVFRSINGDALMTTCDHYYLMRRVLGIKATINVFVDAVCVSSSPGEGKAEYDLFYWSDTGEYSKRASGHEKNDFLSVTPIRPQTSPAAEFLSNDARVEFFFDSRLSQLEQTPYEFTELRTEVELSIFLGVDDYDGIDRRLHRAYALSRYFKDAETRGRQNLMPIVGVRQEHEGKVCTWLMIPDAEGTYEGGEYYEAFLVNNRPMGHGWLTPGNGRAVMRMGIDDIAYKGRGFMKFFSDIRQSFVVQRTASSIILLPGYQLRRSWQDVFFYVRQGFLPGDRDSRRMIIEKYLLPWLSDSSFMLSDEEAAEAFGMPLGDFIEFSGQFLAMAKKEISDDDRSLDLGYTDERNKSGTIDLLSEKIKERIRENGGRITFEEFQRIAAMEGYYRDGRARFGVAATDGVTFNTDASGSVALAYARLFHDLWIEMGRPKNFDIVEQGGGDGAMAQYILDMILQDESLRDLYEHIRYTIIDISEDWSLRQKKRLKGKHPSVNFWVGSVFNMPLESASVEGVFFSNELPDAFPVHRVVTRNGELREIFVTLRDGVFTEEESEVSTDKIIEYFNMVGSIPPEGKEFAVNLHLFEWLSEVERVLKRGFAVNSDYGFEKTQVRYDSTHKESVWNLTHDPELPILTPGIDITHNVDFETMGKIAVYFGLDHEDLRSLDSFLAIFSPVAIPINPEEFISLYSKGIKTSLTRGENSLSTERIINLVPTEDALGNEGLTASPKPMDQSAGKGGARLLEYTDKTPEETEMTAEGLDIYALECMRDKIAVLRDNVPGKDRGEVLLEVKMMSDIVDPLEAAAYAESLRAWRLVSGKDHDSSVVHQLSLDAILKDLDAIRDGRMEGDPGGYIGRNKALEVYFAVSQPNVNGLNRLHIEGILTSEPRGDIPKILMLEIDPDNRDAGAENRRRSRIADVLRRSPESIREARFKGVGRQLLRRALSDILIHNPETERVKMELDGAMPEMVEEGFLSEDMTETRDTVKKNLILRSEEMMNLLRSYAANGDHGSEDIMKMIAAELGADGVPGLSEEQGEGVSTLRSPFSRAGEKDDVLPLWIRNLLTTFTLDKLMIRILKTETPGPFAAVMDGHDGAYNVWETARRKNRLKGKSILVRTGRYADMFPVLKEDIVSEHSVITESLPRLGKAAVTMTELYHGNIDEIYLIESGRGDWDNLVYEALVFEGKDVKDGQVYVDLTMFQGVNPENISEYYRDEYQNISVLRTVKIHMISDPEHMPNLSEDKRPVLWDVSADWYFRKNEKDPDVFRERFERTERYLDRIGRVPEVFTLALSSDETGSNSGDGFNFHGEFLARWAKLIPGVVGSETVQFDAFVHYESARSLPGEDVSRLLDRVKVSDEYARGEECLIETINALLPPEPFVTLPNGKKLTADELRAKFEEFGRALLASADISDKLKQAFIVHYDEISDVDEFIDEDPEPRKWMRDIVREISREYSGIGEFIKRSPSVLELGPLTYHGLSDHFYVEGVRIKAIDRVRIPEPPVYLEVLSGKGKGLGDYNDWFKNADPDSIDLIYSRAGLYAFMKDYGAGGNNPDGYTREQLIRKRYGPIHRVLKPGGIVIATYFRHQDEDYVPYDEMNELMSDEEMRSAGFELVARYPDREGKFMVNVMRKVVESDGVGALPGTPDTGVQVNTLTDIKRHADALFDFMKMTQANEETKISFLALGREWIDKVIGDHPQKDYADALITAIRCRCEDKNIRFIYNAAGDEKVINEIKDLKAADLSARGIALAGVDTVKGIESLLAAMEFKDDHGVTLAAVDTSSLTADSFLPLTEMFEVLFELAAQPLAAEVVRIAHENTLGFEFELRNGRVSRVIFTPRAEPLGQDIEEFRLRYKLQISA